MNPIRFRPLAAGRHPRLQSFDSSEAVFHSAVTTGSGHSIQPIVSSLKKVDFLVDFIDHRQTLVCRLACLANERDRHQPDH